VERSEVRGALSYLTVAACTSLLLTGGVALFNALIDPLDLMGTPALQGWSDLKTAVSPSGGRRFKAAQLAKAKPDILLLGSSRVEVGIPAEHAGYGRARVYNAALSGTNMVEIESVFNAAVKWHPPREVVLGLDFEAFGERRGYVADFSDSLFARSKLVVTLRYLFSISALRLSWRTLVDSRRYVFADYDANGVNHHFERLASPDQRQMFTSVLRDQFFINPETYAGFHFAPDRMAALWRLVNLCAERGITLRLFITPVHARQLEALRAIGLYEGFERWQRMLAEGVSKIGRERPQATLSLWDFSGYHEFATESVPAAARSQPAMKWYWESSHFKAALGKRLLDRMYRLPPSATLPEDFGVELRADTLDSWLEKTRRARVVYATSQPAEVREVERLAACTSRIWPVMCKDCTAASEVAAGRFVPCAG